MNERIKELAAEAGMLTGWQIGEVEWKKFAELIVEECCQALHPILRDMISRGQGVDLIKKHFGVE